MVTKAMSDEEYVEKQGIYCPFCHTKCSMVTGEFRHDESYAWQPCVCEVCNKEWDDVYELTGFTEVT